MFVRVALSTAPTWEGRALEPRPLILRCYICATPDGFTVMPGGLTRVSPSAESLVVSSRYGGGSKDTWVRSPGLVQNTTPVEAEAPSTRRGRIVSHVPSRIVENLFWLGRNAERLEDTTRMLRIALKRWRMFSWFWGRGGGIGSVCATQRTLQVNGVRA